LASWQVRWQAFTVAPVDGRWILSEVVPKTLCGVEIKRCIGIVLAQEVIANVVGWACLSSIARWKIECDGEFCGVKSSITASVGLHELPFEVRVHRDLIILDSVPEVFEFSFWHVVACKVRNVVLIAVAISSGTIHAKVVLAKVSEAILDLSWAETIILAWYFGAKFIFCDVACSEGKLPCWSRRVGRIWTIIWASFN
jgi:hypothetical protein